MCIHCRFASAVFANVISVRLIRFGIRHEGSKSLGVSSDVYSNVHHALVSCFTLGKENFGIGAKAMDRNKAAHSPTLRRPGYHPLYY